MKSSIAFVCFLFLVGSASAEVEFSALDLGQTLLFSAQSSSPAQATYRAWFRSDVANKSIEALTFYPETVTYLPKTGQLQLQNRFGVYRLSADASAVQQISPESFEKKVPLGEGKLLPMLFSPDGQYALYFHKTSAVSADLMLYEISTGNKTLITSDAALSFSKVPALWSPDSQFFLFEKKNLLTYFSLKQFVENRVPSEELRRVGAGLISSVTWGPSGELYYVQSNVLYRILPEEFFTRSLYGGRFQTWGIVGKLPFPFRPADDQFWLGGSRRNILFNLGGRTLFLYPLQYLDYYQNDALQALAYVPLPQNLSVRKVLWGSDEKITILTASLTLGREVSQVLRLAGAQTQILNAGTDTVTDLSFSPGEGKILVTTGSGLSVRDASSFAETAHFALPGTVGGFWKDEQNLLASGGASTIQINLKDGSQKLLFLGGLDEAGTSDLGSLAGRQGKIWYTYSGNGIWKLSPIDLKLSPPQAANPGYRAYTDELSSGPYKNWILIRNLKALTTEPLFPRPPALYEDFPTAEEASDSGIFSHGSRLRAREVTLAIDALDSADGLPTLLRDLRDWGFQTTFFVNGEFLRRNPQAAIEISRSSHEAANLFHVPLNLTDSAFSIDQDFVRQGLARQEDDWFRVTGKELALLWHAPGWSFSPLLAAGAAGANYLTVGRDVTYPLADNKTVDSLALILQILKDKKPGSIVPLTLGMKDSTTGESFFNRLDLLLNALVEAGYRVVPVSQLIDRTRKQ